MEPGGVAAQLGQAACSHLGGDQGGPVTIASDPGGEADTRIGVFLTETVERPAVILPGGLQRAVEAHDHVGEYLPEVVDRIAQFVLNAGALNEDFAGIPERFQLGGQ